MTEQNEDMLFKNVSEKDASILLDIIGKKSKKVKVWTKELRHIDPTNFKPDLILELDNQNLILEFLSTPVDNKFSRRGHSYVALTDQKKENKKEVNFEVLSTAEDSKIVEYKYNELNSFKYKVTGLNNLASDEIITNVTKKLENKKVLNGKEIILLSLVPLSKKGKNIAEYIYRVVDILSKVRDLSVSLTDLAFGIMWLTTDKFIEDSLEKSILCDFLGDRMTLMHEYGENKFQNGKNEGIEEGRKEGREEIIVNLLKSKDNPETIAEKTKIPLEKILEIKEKYNV